MKDGPVIPSKDPGYEALVIAVPKALMKFLRSRGDPEVIASEALLSSAKRRGWKDADPAQEPLIEIESPDEEPKPIDDGPLSLEDF
jgi:hypothetical protein